MTEMEGAGWVDGEQVWDVESPGLASGFKSKRGRDQGNCEHLGRLLGFYIVV